MTNQVSVVVNDSSLPTVVEVSAPGPQGIAGPTGPAGIGPAWQQGAGAPGSGVGSNGDFYLNTSNGNVYGPKTAGVWGAVIFNIAEGQDGPAGPIGPDGADGREVELRSSGGYVQWRYVGVSTWSNLIALSAITGPAGAAGAAGSAGADGREIELQKSSTHVQWRYVGGSTWTNLIPLADLVGPAGAQGSQGAAGANGRTILNGSGAPGSGVGSDGDFYIDTTASKLYGPKSSGAWGGGTSLVGPAGPTGSEGASGSTGATGASGASATIAVGTVTTGAAGTSASVTNTGTSSAAVLAFTVPRGDTGAPGATGPAGTTDYNNLLNKPTLGTAAATAATDYATAAQGTKADSAIQPSDSRLTDARTPVAHNQAASTITGLATVATSGAYGDLSGRPTLGTAAPLNVGTTAGTVAAGDDSRFTDLKNRLDAFRDAATFYVSKRGTASDSNNGTSPGEPFLTIGAAVTAAKSYITANPGLYAKIDVGPGTFTEANLPFRPGPKVYAKGQSQRDTILKPAAGQELNGFFALDSECMVEGFRFSGHQATGTSSTDSSIGTRAWAVRFDETANSGQGPIIYASPYVKDCASITAETDAGLAGSTSTGDTGGGVEIDGAKVHPSSPVRSMVVYGFTQQNLGGPGVIIKNDAYGELVSFFGLFCTWHVQAETGGWATLSGGGCSEFGIYGVVADGYSPTALYTGALRVAASSGATSVDVVSLSANRLGSSSRPHNGQIMLLGGTGYVVVSSSPINSSGTVVADSDGSRAGYRLALHNPTGAGLVAAAAQGAAADFRRRSQVSAGCHTSNFVGSGTNYNALPWNGGVPVRANQFVERNFGRVFGLSVNDAGDISAAGGAFAVDGTSGSVTINTTQFNLSGLNAIGPFSRNIGLSTVGVQIQEASNNVTLLSSTGSSDGNTVPTQFAVRSYADNRYLAGLTVTGSQPISISDTSTQDGQGFWTRSQNISLSLNVANGLARLDGSGLIPSSLLPSYVDDVLEYANQAAFPATGETGKIYVSLATNLTYRWSGSSYIEISASPGSTDAVTEGSVNLYFTNARARAAISVTGSLSYSSGVISYTAPTLATVATSGAYADLSGKPTLGTAAATAATAYATAAQGATADTAIQPGNAALTDAREWSAATIDQPEAETGTATTRRAFTAQRVFQAVAAWWAASAAATKLGGIATGATANSSDATLLARANHTGTQAASTIIGLGSLATQSATLPAGTIVGTTDTQTLTNKTLGTTTETIAAITDGASVDLNPTNGAIQTWTLGASRTATASSFAAGASMLLCVDDGSAFTLTWPTITWVGSTTAPTLATTGYTFIQLWKIGTTLYGMAQK